MAVAVPGAVPSLWTSGVRAAMRRATVSRDFYLPPLCSCPGLPHAVYVAEVLGEKNGFFHHSVIFSRVHKSMSSSGQRRGARGRAQKRCSQASVRMLDPPELWPVRHHKRMLSLLYFQHLAVP